MSLPETAPEQWAMRVTPAAVFIKPAPGPAWPGELNQAATGGKEVNKPLVAALWALCDESDSAESVEKECRFEDPQPWG